MAAKKYRRAFITRQIAQLEEHLAAVEEDLATAPTTVIWKKLQTQADQILAKIEEFDDALKRLDADSSNPNVKDRSFDKALQKIDFAKAKNIARSIKAKLNPEGGVVLFFLQKSKKQMGHYCVEEVLQILMGDEIVEGEIVVDYRRIPVELDSAISQYDETEFLTRLGSYFNVDAGEDMVVLSEQIRGTIRQSIDQGMTIFLEIKGVDDLLEQETFIAWFVDEFWKPLTDEIRLVSKNYRSKFIVALIADSQILTDCSTDYFCAEDGYDCYKMLELPLPDWTVEDIYSWLIPFRSLSDSMKQKTDVELRKLAERIRRETDGTPQNVCANLRERFL